MWCPSGQPQQQLAALAGLPLLPQQPLRELMPRSVSQNRWWLVLSAVSQAEPPQAPGNPSPGSAPVVVSLCCLFFLVSVCVFKETAAVDVCVAAKHPSPWPACVYIPPGKEGCISTFCKVLSKTALAAGNGFSSQQIASLRAPSQQRRLLERAPGALPGDHSELGGSSWDAFCRAPASLLRAQGWLGHGCPSGASRSCWDLCFPGRWWECHGITPVLCGQRRCG